MRMTRVGTRQPSDMVESDRDTNTAGSRYTLPQEPLFTRLLALASRPTIGDKPAIIDVNNNIQKTLPELLSDAIHLRTAISSQLSPQTIKDLENDDEVYIHLLAPGGYEFTVGVLAILSLGAACSPLSTAQPASELTYYARKTRAVGILTSTQANTTGQTLARSIESRFDEQVTTTTAATFFHVPVSSSLDPNRPLILPSQIIITNGPNRRDHLNPNGPSIVIFTSGTTGPPKAAVLSRGCITDSAMSVAGQLGLTSEDKLLHLLPVHHATGIWVSFFPFLQSGATIEFKPGNFDPGWTWNRWLSSSTLTQDKLTHFSGVPTIYMRMMRHYNEILAPNLTRSQLKKYDLAARQFKVMMCGTSALPKPIDDFWTRTRGGVRIVQRYGSTELGVVFNMPSSNQPNPSSSSQPLAVVPDGSVGHTSLGVDVKLSPQDGEILARSYSMFTKYLHDPQATRDAFDEKGYFKSGDVARQDANGFWFIVGRKSVDIIKSGGYKISALDVEREVLALGYVGECMVVGVDDGEFGQRVGCVVSLRSGYGSSDGETDATKLKLDLETLRDDIRPRLAGYKLPTLLRVIQGEIPKGATGKVIKKTLGPFYFPVGYERDPEVQVWKRRREGDDGKSEISSASGSSSVKAKL